MFASALVHIARIALLISFLFMFLSTICLFVAFQAIKEETKKFGAKRIELKKRIKALRTKVNFEDSPMLWQGIVKTLLIVLYKVWIVFRVHTSSLILYFFIF